MNTFFTLLRIPFLIFLIVFHFFSGFNLVFAYPSVDTLAQGDTNSTPPSNKTKNPASPQKVDQYPQLDAKALAALPVLDGGRIKPLDTYARNLLLQFSGRSSYKGQSALNWFVRFLFSPASTRDDQIFMINHPEVINALELTLPEKRRFSLTELEPGFSKLNELVGQIEKIEPKQRNAVEAELFRLFQNLTLYINHFPTLRFLEPSADLGLRNNQLAQIMGMPQQNAYSYYDILPRLYQIGPIIQSFSEKGGPVDSLSVSALNLSQAMFYRSEMYRNLPFLSIPPHDSTTELWLSPWDALHALNPAHPNLELLRNWNLLYTAWYTQNQTLFQNEADSLVTESHGFISSLKAQKASQISTSSIKLKYEVLYNKLGPFFYGKWLYLFASIFLLLSGLVWQKKLRLAAQTFIGLSFMLHTVGLLARMWIMDRPPVTNLFETFIFVGWVCVLLGYILEKIQKNGLGYLISSLAGLVMLVIAGKYAREGDTLGMLVAVLDSNFWLSTHVVTITMGYAGCIAAGILGHVYLWQWMLKKPADVLQKINSATLGLLGFGLVLSFVGTVLGGIWADQSWGRFWGWDPKENGALLIVLWSAIIFHARWDGLIKAYGVAQACIFGNIIVAFAWFGVNLLGVGLHSYGFTSGVFINLMAFYAFEVLYMFVMALMYWQRQQNEKV